MDVERAFHLTSYITVATTLVTLALSEGSIGILAVVIVCVLLAWLQEARRRAHYLPGWLATGLAFVALAGAFLDARLWSGSYVLAAAHLLAFLQILKLYQPKQNRDYLQLYLLSLLNLIVASVMTTALSFSIAFMIYLLAASWSLMLFHIRRELSRQELATGMRTPTSRLSGRFMASFSIITLLTFLVTLSIFFLAPRVTMGFLRRAPNLPQVVAGFSEEVSLTEIGRIKQSRARVLRVEPPGRRPVYGRRRLWRGKAFDEYTGAGWSTSDSRRTWMRADRAGYVRLPTIAPLQRQSDAAFRFTLREINTSVVFTTYYARGIAGPSRALAIDRFGTVYTGLQHYFGTGYVVQAQVGGSEGAAPPRFLRDGLRTYLAMPPNSERIARLARRATQGAHSVPEQAAALERYLRRTYGYTLDLKPAFGRDPVEHFLFERREGHCELFASAMVLMSRSLGIPTRYVTGFSGGEWNEFGKYYLVRQLDAHSWVEVYTPKTGWTPYDPTPAAPAQSEAGFLAGLGIMQRYIDALRVRWHAYIIDYSLRHQLRVTTLLRVLAREGYKRLEQAAATGVSYVERIRRGLRSLLEKARRVNLRSGLALLLAALLGAALAGRLVRRFLRRRRRRRRTMSTTPTYAAFLKMMERHRLAKPPHLTPAEYARALHVETGVPAAAVEALTTGYYTVRFGRAPLSVAEQAAERAALETVRAALRTVQPIARTSP